MWGEEMSVFIIGSGMTKIGRHFSKGFKELAMESLSKALQKSGVSGNDLDYLIVSTAFPQILMNQSDPARILAQELGLKDLKALRVEYGEASGSAALEVAKSLLEAGRARYVAVVGFEKLTEYPTDKTNYAYSTLLDFEYEVVRNITPPSYAAMIMREFMKRRGVSKEEIAAWSVNMHEKASTNPLAQLPFKITREKALNGVVISEPLTLYDAFPLGDGAASIILSGEEGLRKASAEPVEVQEITQAVGHPLYLRDDLTFFEATSNAWRELSSRAGIAIDKNTAIQVQDAYSIYGLLALEALGIGEAGKLLTSLDDMPFLNVGGGLKARGHPVGATPLYAVAENYELMTSGFNGLKYDGEYSLIHSMTGPDLSAYLILLRRWK